MVKPVQPQTVQPVSVQAQSQTVQPVAPEVAQSVPVATAAPVVPAQSLSPIAPSGPVVSQAPCCPDVATFEGSTGPRSSYFGFDDKTNLVANVGADEYWVPPTDAKTLPGSKEDRDGARWVSVGVGREAQVEINFGGAFTNTCLGNCTYEIVPATVAEVSSPSPTASGVAFKIKGKAAGEASVKVICDGQLRGYFHIWCVQPAVIHLDVCSIVTTRTSTGAYTSAGLKAALDEIYRQAVISFDINDLGVLDFTSDAAMAAFETPFYSTGQFKKTTAALIGLDLFARRSLSARAAITNPALRASLANTNLPRPDAMRLYFYVPTVGANGLLGSVINMGKSPAFTTTNSSGVWQNATAHELGHSLDMVHPNDTATAGGASRTAQFPAHHLSSLGVAVPALPSTNTEPAVPSTSSHSNIMKADPLNLMGYLSNRPITKPLRYRQWKNCRRTA